MSIAWKTEIKQNQTYQNDDGSWWERQYALEHRRLCDLRRHEKVSRRRLAKILLAMHGGEPQHLVSVGEDGMVLDGHARIEAAIILLGADATIPVEVHRFTQLGS